MISRGEVSLEEAIEIFNGKPESVKQEIRDVFGDFIGDWKVILIRNLKKYLQVAKAASSVVTFRSSSLDAIAVDAWLRSVDKEYADTEPPLLSVITGEQPDYKSILGRYVLLVINQEGIDFLKSAYGSKNPFLTEEEEKLILDASVEEEEKLNKSKPTTIKPDPNIL